MIKNGWLVAKVIRCSLGGWPDRIAIKNGVTIFIEIKDIGKDLSDVQKYRVGQINKHGAIAFKAESVEELIDNLEVYNLI